jgi:hypothetical protein
MPPHADPDAEKAAAQAESNTLLNDVRDGINRALRVWTKVHDPARSALQAGQHTIVVLQAGMAAIAETAAGLALSNPNADREWLRSALLGQFEAVWSANFPEGEPN